MRNRRDEPIVSPSRPACFDPGQLGRDCGAPPARTAHRAATRPAAALPSSATAAKLRRMTAAAPTSAKPRILISRAIFPQVVDRLASHFDVESNQADELWSP